MPHHERLSVLDEMFLHLETPQTPMNVGAVAIFEGPPPDLADLVRSLETRLHLVPRLRQRLALVPWGLHRPVWVDDADFDLGHHVVETTRRSSAAGPSVPAPGLDRPAFPHTGLARPDLHDVVAEVAVRRFDRDRPLWALHVVDGLREDGWALVATIHHSLVDGVAGTQVLGALLTTDPAADPVPPEPWRPRPMPSRNELLDEALRDRLEQSSRALASLRLASEAGELEQRAERGLRALGDFLGSAFGAPPTGINRPVGAARRFDTVDLDLGELKRIGASVTGGALPTRGTVNDAALAAVTGGLRRLFEARGEPVDQLRLRALVPVSLRGDGRSAGNSVSGLWATLPVHEPDPMRRLRSIRSEMDRLKSSSQAEGGRTLAHVAAFAPSFAIAQATRLLPLQRAFNLAISNVPGPRAPLYAVGRRMQEIYPTVPLAPNTSLGIALLSYAGAVGVGLVADRDSTPDLPLLAEGIEKSVAELSALLS